MSFIPSTFKCNGCAIEHTPTNGWYELHVQRADGVSEASLYICEFKGSEAAEHYCGAGCLLPAISSRLRLLHLGPAPSLGELLSEPMKVGAWQGLPPNTRLMTCTCSYEGGVSTPDPYCEVHGHAL